MIHICRRKLEGLKRELQDQRGIYSDVIPPGLFLGLRELNVVYTKNKHR